MKATEVQRRYSAWLRIGLTAGKIYRSKITSEALTTCFPKQRFPILYFISLIGLFLTVMHHRRTLEKHAISHEEKFRREFLRGNRGGGLLWKSHKILLVRNLAYCSDTYDFLSLWIREHMLYKRCMGKGDVFVNTSQRGLQFTLEWPPIIDLYRIRIQVWHKIEGTHTQDVVLTLYPLSTFA